MSQGDKLTPEEIIEKVIAEFNLTEEQTADMDIQQYIALALELGIELDDDFYSYFDTVMPSPMAVDDKPASAVKALQRYCTTMSHGTA